MLHYSYQAIIIYCRVYFAIMEGIHHIIEKGSIILIKVFSRVLNHQRHFDIRRLMNSIQAFNFVMKRLSVQVGWDNNRRLLRISNAKFTLWTSVLGCYLKPITRLPGNWLEFYCTATRRCVLFAETMISGCIQFRIKLRNACFVVHRRAKNNTIYQIYNENVFNPC